MDAAEHWDVYCQIVSSAGVIPPALRSRKVQRMLQNSLGLKQSCVLSAFNYIKQTFL